MKNGNTLLCLALAGTLAISNAQAAGPTLYGVINLSLDSLNNGDDSGLNVSSNSSRLGVKGEIDLADGMIGIYQVESEFDADDSSGGTLATRNTFIGASGGFGTARVGRLDTPVKAIGRQVDLFGDQVGDARNITRAGSGLNRFDERPTNSADYTTPERSGIKGTLQYSTNNDATATATNDNDVLSVAVNYADGPVYAALGYETVGNPDPSQDDPDIIRLGGYYELGAWRLTALWQTISGSAGDGSLDQDVYGLGARYKHGNWAFKGQAYQLMADAEDSDANMFALGAEYVLHKGITLYADYAMTENDDNRGVAPYTAGRGDSLVVAAGESASAVSLGAIFRF